MTNDDSNPAIAGPTVTEENNGLLELATLLRRSASAIEAIAGTFPAPRLPMPLPVQDRARTTRRYAHTDHPRLLPRGTEPMASKVVDTPAFREAFRPGDQVEVYAGGGEGYRRVSRNLCVPYYKIGVTGRWRVAERFRQHKRTRYGSFWWHDGRYVEDGDFADQFPSLINTTLTLSSASPVRATHNSVVVTLPLTMSPDQFEHALRKKLAHAAVHRWLATDEGLRHCEVLRVDPAIGIRMTGYGQGDAKRMSPR